MYHETSIHLLTLTFLEMWDSERPSFRLNVPTAATHAEVGGTCFEIERNEAE